MKKSLFLAIVAACVMVSCSKNKNENQHAEGLGVEPTPQSSEDIITRQFKQGVYIPGTISGSPLGDAIYNRCNEFSSSYEDADVIVIPDDIVLALSDNDYIEIAKALNTGDVVCYLQPTYASFGQFTEGLVNAYETMLENEGFGTASSYFDPGIIMSSAFRGTSSDVFARMLAFCDRGLFVMGKDDDFIISESCTQIDPDTQEEAIVDRICPDDDFEDTPLDNGMMVEMLLDWIMEQTIYLDEPTVKSGEPVLEPGRKEYKYVGKISYSAKSSDVDCSLTRSVPLVILYEYWPVCDRSDNSIKDVYAIRRTIKIDGKMLETGPEQKDYWWTDSKGNAKYYGPYLYRVKASTECNAVTAMRELKPLNSMTSTTYGESTSMGVNIGVGISAKPSLNPTFSYSKSYSTSTSVPDLKTVVSTKSGLTLPEYTFIATKRPDSHFGIYATHDIVPDNYHQYIELQTSWIWEMNNPRDEAHPYRDNVEIDIEMMDFREGFFKTIPSYHDKTYSFSVDFNLAGLPHYNQKWGVEVNCEGMSRDEKLKLMDWIEGRYPDYYSNKLFNVPADSMSDRTGIKEFKNNFIDVLNRDVQIWKNLDYFGTFNFTWRNNGDPSETYTFDFIVNK